MSLDESNLSPAQLAELSALADGSLDPSRRQDVEAWIATSPELRERFEREQRVVAAVHQLRTQDRAPEHLRARIEASRRRPARRRARRLGLIASAGVALAAVIAVIALVIPAGTPGGPSISQAAALASRGASAPAPVPQPGDYADLTTHVGSLHFPNWASVLWRAVGQRTDRIDGRYIATVYYRTGHYQLAYSIVARPALSVSALESTEYATLRIGHRTVVVWTEDGHTCVLSAVGLPVSTLRNLAMGKAPASQATAWNANGAGGSIA